MCSSEVPLKAIQKSFHEAKFMFPTVVIYSEQIHVCLSVHGIVDYYMSSWASSSVVDVGSIHTKPSRETYQTSRILEVIK